MTALPRPTKKLLTAVLMTLMSILALSSCVSANSHLIINRGGSADLAITAKLGVSPITAATARGIVDAIRPFLEQKGLALQYTEDDCGVELTLDKHVDDLAALLDLLPASAAAQPNTDLLQVQRGLLLDSYQVRLNLALHDWLAEYLSPWNLYLARMAMETNDISLQVTLPWLPKEHNADFIADRGHTLGWQLELDQPRQLYLSLQMPNQNCWRLARAFPLLMLIAGALWLIRKRTARRWR